MSFIEGEEVGPMAVDLAAADPFPVFVAGAKHARTEDHDTIDEPTKKLRMMEDNVYEENDCLSHSQGQALTTAAAATEAFDQAVVGDKSGANLVKIPVATKADECGTPNMKKPATNRVSLSPTLRARKREQNRQDEQSPLAKPSAHHNTNSTFTSRSPSPDWTGPMRTQVAAMSRTIDTLNDGENRKLALLFIVLACLLAIAQGFLPRSSMDTLQAGINADEENSFLLENPHILPPSQSTNKAISPQWAALGPPNLSKEVTLRSFLQDTDRGGFSLGMAPAFFGFYGYFGVLAAWDEHLTALTLQTKPADDNMHASGFLRSGLIRRLAGASAGAMAAVLLAAGIPPRVAADFCTTITLDRFADFPGLGALFKGDLFEKIMQDFLKDNMAQKDDSTLMMYGDSSPLLLQNAPYPVAVSGFDLQSMEGKILTRGSMARAARASATFPLLFQPVGWIHEPINATSQSITDQEMFTLIDGGLADMAGIAALDSLKPKQPTGERIVNLKVGPFYFGPPGPTEIDNCAEIVSISIQNLPQCGPFAMEMGPVAVSAAYDAMVASLDLPLYVTEFKSNDDSEGEGEEQMTRMHYELHIDASKFWKD